MSEYLDSGAAKLISDLAASTAKADILTIHLGETLGSGLPDTIPTLFNRSNQSLTSLASLVETYRQAPARRKGIAHVETLESFVQLTKRHMDENSAIFACTKLPDISLTTVVDYHALNHEPQWGTHKILYKFPMTDEFKVWTDRNAKGFAQNEFAAFLEDHAAELTTATAEEIVEFEPLFKEKFAAPNELIGLSRDLEVYVGAKVKQGIRLSSGERTLEFTEEHHNGKGEKVEIPGLFMISVPAWVDSTPLRLPARLRYRLAGGSISWSYQLYRPDAYLRNKVVEDLIFAGTETGLPTFIGTPEAA